MNITKLLAEAHGPLRRHPNTSAPEKGLAGSLEPGDTIAATTIVTIDVDGYGFRNNRTYRKLRITLEDGTVVHCASDRPAGTCR